VPLVAGALQGHVTSGFGVSRDSLLFQAVAVPIAVPGSAPSGANFKLGGVVLERSIQRDSQTLRVDFTVTDRFHEIPVAYTGILPDLFREGQSIIATGRMEGGRFVAREVLAKHDETYMPKEVSDAIAKAKSASAHPQLQ